MLSHTHLSLVDSLSGSLTTKSLDISRLVLDIGNIDVDESQTNLLQFHLYIGRDTLKELIAVGIQLLDAHCSNNKTKLTKEDITSQFLNLTSIKTKQTLSSGSHAIRLGRNTNGKSARHIHTDILLRKCIGEVGIYRNRCKTKILIVFYDRPHEGTTTMHTLCRRFRLSSTIDNQNLI